MTAPRKLPGYRYLPLCLLVVASCALAETRDMRVHGPADDTGAECADADAPELAVAPASRKVAVPAKPAGAARIKPVVTVRGSDDGSAHAPRWHSFLPGMFR